MNRTATSLAGIIGVALAACGIGSAAEAAAPESTGWQPAAGSQQIPLWPKGLAIQRPQTVEPEATGIGSETAAGRPWTYIANVSRPTLTIYPPTGKNTGAAIMVLPGGGYKVVAIDIEGTEVCDWVTAHGMTCILLKYRVPQAWRPHDPEHEQAPAVQLPLQDAQRAMGLVRQRAEALGIDPSRIGVIGFSAGGHLVAAVSNAEKRSYASVDAADAFSFRPDFAIALYPGHVWDEHSPDDSLRLSPWITISRKAPATFLVQSMNDPVDDVHHSVAYAMALRQAGVPVELHLYAEGGHAFGLRPTHFPISGWPDLLIKWLHTIQVF